MMIHLNWGRVGLAVFAFVLSMEPMCSAEVDPTRFASEILEFETKNKERPVQSDAVLCVGSSTMRRWGERIESDLFPLTLIPRGFGGSHYSDVLYYFDELVVNFHPRAILIYEGDNDLNSGKTPEHVFSDFQVFRNRVKEFDPSIRIYVVGVKPSIARWHLKSQIEETNRLIESACEMEPNLVYIDVSKFLLDEFGDPRPEVFVEDGIHLNTIGYNLWAAAIALKLVPAESPYELN